VVDKVALGKDFLRILPLSPVSIITPMPRDILHVHVANIQKAKRAKPGNCPASSAVAEVRKHWIGKYSQRFKLLKV
jgi:hypothetical protein